MAKVPGNYPLDIQVEFEKAEHALQIRRYDLVIQIMSDILSVQPEESDAFVYIARAYYLKKNLQKALEAITASLRLNPNNDYAHMLYGLILSDKGEKTRANEEFQTALKLDRFNASTHYLYADSLYKMDDIEAARKHLIEALELNPEQADYHVLMAAILDKEGNFTLAEKEYREALRLDPESFEALNDYGVHLLNIKNNPHEAFDIFSQAIRLSPNVTTIRENFLQCLKAKNKYYALFWNFSLGLSKMGHFRWFFLVAFIIYPRYLFQRINNNSLFSLSLIIVLALFSLYTWSADYIFDYMIKRDWIK